MPRQITYSFRHAAEARYSGDVDLVFLTISHPLLIEPIRTVWDTVDFVYGGSTFIGFPFDLTILTDDDKPPKAQLSIQNVDPRIGNSVRSLRTPARLKCEILSSQDFDLTVKPRQPLGTPTAVYMADKTFLTNVKVDILVLTGDIVGWDYLQRVWPGIRATQDRLPGLFR